MYVSAEKQTFDHDRYRGKARPKKIQHVVNFQNFGKIQNTLKRDEKMFNIKTFKRKVLYHLLQSKIIFNSKLSVKYFLIFAQEV